MQLLQESRAREEALQGQVGMFGQGQRDVAAAGALQVGALLSFSTLPVP